MCVAIDFINIIKLKFYEEKIFYLCSFVSDGFCHLWRNLYDS
jgi:hypothetical protein